MLFDLQGKRHRGIQVIYLLLAIIMVGGLILFGIGGAVSGGLVDAFRDQTSVSFDKEVEELETQLQTQPNNPGLLAELIQLKYQVAVEQSPEGIWSEEGLATLAEIDDLWQRFAKTEAEADSGLLNLVYQVYSPDALNQPKQMVLVAQEITAIDPSAQSYYQLAYASLLADNQRIASLAEKQALEEAENKEEREQIEIALEQVRQQIQSPIQEQEVPGQ
jgi:hypothetical protein